MFEVSLSDGAVALVDDSDGEIVSSLRWHHHTEGYAVANEGKTLMHRLILAAPRGVKVDHENGDKLDNRRSNIRLATTSLNGHNRHAPLTTAVGIPGVRRPTKKGTYSAYIAVNNKLIYLGTHPTLLAAATARAEAELEHFGDLDPHTRAWFDRMRGEHHLRAFHG